MANTYRTVRIQGDGVQREAIANEAFYPGALLEKLSTGKVQKHTGKGCVAPTYTPRPLMVAMENSLVGIGVGTGTLNGTFVTITKQWAAGDNVSYLIPGPGDVVAMLLKGFGIMTPGRQGNAEIIMRFLKIRLEAQRLPELDHRFR